MKKRALIILFLIGGLFLWLSEKGIISFFSQKAPQPYIIEQPDLFFKMKHLGDNPLTQEGVELGRYLFYDPILSLDSTISCSSCHLQALAFTDGKAVSTGIHGRAGKRSAPTLVNIGYHYKGLFWDSRSPALEEQALHPVEDSVEMGNQWAQVIDRLQKHATYPRMFKKAFGIKKKDIQKEWVARALSQFQRTLVSANAKYDQMLKGEATFTLAEQRGMSIFFDSSDTLPFSECGHCHTDPLFTHLGLENNGVDPQNRPAPDNGKGALSGYSFDNGQFKVPTLRNITLTAPYMHDGRFQTLEEVIDHYAGGGHPGPNVSPNVRPLKLSERDKQDLIAFLQTLTDSTVLERKEWGRPR